MSSGLVFKENIREDSVEIAVSGEVDIYTSQSLKDKLYSLIDTYKSDLEIDCANLNYIDSTGLGIFVGTLKKAKEYGKQISIMNLKDNIRKLFLITSLDKLFIIK